ncbi:hypothetical protein CEE37_12485 [candidate division LCP-89 bacterium B3_LCP]|uniref:histidine kinase n=1 Tax=candidate division LCP-89 bacterium B3_LCP TaxID=2012998 RepID=A0A532UUE8_UNCL8|nr:MAG: hypothetical protein CEE37_12485 [candidate division LCP-89 bacterium B3_LCP]
MNNSDFKILVCDSNSRVLSRLRRILSEDKFNVWTSSDPGEILRICESGNFDLLILDITIYAQLKNQGFSIDSEDMRAAPVIIMTTNEDFPLAIEAIEDGAIDFLDKPIKVKRLLITIKNTLLHSSKLKQMRIDQDELTTLKELYEAIINGIDYGIVVLDQHLRIESINEHQKRKLRSVHATVAGTHCYRYFYDRNTICDDCKIKEVFLNRTPVKYSIVNKAVGGLNYYLEVEAFPLFDKKGDVTRVVQLIKDVTERVRLEKELLEKKEYLESLVSHAPVGIFTADNSGFIRTANPTFADLLGADSSEAVIGLNVLESEEFTKEGLDAEFSLVLSQGKHLDLPSVHCNSRWGKEWICGLRCVPLKGGEGEITGLIATVVDVTEKWKLEENYRKRITELTIFKAVGELLQSTIALSDIFAIGLIGVTAGKGLGFNRAFLLRYDRRNNTLIGETAIGPSDTAEAGQIWTELYEKDLSLEDIFRNYVQNADERDAQVKEVVKGLKIPITWDEGFLHDVLFDNIPKYINNASKSEDADQRLIAQVLDSDSYAVAPLISRGKTEGVIIADNLITSKDITAEDLNRLSIISNQLGAAIENSQLLQNLEEKIGDLRQAYLDLKENRDLLLRAERLSVVGEVAASVAHEIRNPLTSIGGFTRAVLRDLDKNEKFKTNRRFLSIILEEVKRLERIVNDILGFVKPVTSRFENRDLSQVVEQTFSMMAGEIDENSIIITRDYEENLSAVWIDEDQIRQVFLNLFRNALHAMKGGGMLSVITKMDNDTVKLYISDTGVGIPEEHKNKLFTAFFTTKSTGSGLGLTVSSQIIRNHGGKIEVESQEGEGTTFIITLPLSTQEDRYEETNSSRGRREKSPHSL